MAGVVDTVSTINNAIRTLLAAVALGGIGVAGWFGYTTYREGDIAQEKLADTQTKLAEQKTQLDQARREIDRKETQIGKQQRTIIALDEAIKAKDIEIGQKDDRIAELDEEVEQQKIEIDRLATAVRLLKVDTRLARIDVLDQKKDTQTGRLKTTIEFVELNQQGESIGKPRRFELDGDMVYVDYLVAKFEDKYVEEGDLLRATSICLFNRIFGEYQEPSEGYRIDTVGDRPGAYAQSDEVSEFEEKIWKDFWNIAADPEKAQQLGIRAAHGDAVYMRLKQGMSYKLTLRASGGLSIKPDGRVQKTQEPA